MLRGLGELTLLAGASGLLLLCLSCAQALDSGEAQAAIDSAAPGAEAVLASLPSLHQPSEKVEASFSFMQATPPETADGKAQLSFEVSGAVSGRETMELADPQHPKGAALDLECCSVKVEPRICTAKTKGSDECAALGGYAVDITDADGKPMGAFVIDGCGMLAPARQSRVVSYSAELSYSRNVGATKTRYMIYPKRTEGGIRRAALAVEYECNDEATAHEFSAPDGWHYTYSFPDGTLRIYPPEAVEALRDEVAADNRIAGKGAGAVGGLSGGAGCAPSSGGG